MPTIRRKKVLSWFYYSGIAGGTTGILFLSPGLMAFSSILAGLGFALRDYLARGNHTITPMTIYGLVWGTWTGLGHFLALMFLDTPHQQTFYSYAIMDEDYLLVAQVIATMSVMVPLLAHPFWTNSIRRHKLVQLPEVGFEVPEKTAIFFCLTLLGLAWVTTLGGIVIRLGTITTFIIKGSEIAIFLLAWHWFGPAPTFPRWTWWLLICAVVADTVYAALFSFMRGEIVYPIFSFFLAVLLRKAAGMRLTVVALASLVFVGLIYGSLEENRRVYGGERIKLLLPQFLEDYDQSSLSDNSSGFLVELLPFAARGCQFGQLSHVARIAEEEGHYYGETFAYILYAFIPRIIWPDKPIIAPGQWFAAKIGRGQWIGANRFSNSINMSYAGEMYLNFGWIGVVMGLIFFSLIFSLFWETTRLYTLNNNPIGQILAFAVVTQAAWTNSVSGILNLCFLYISTLSLRWGLGFLRKRRGRATSSVQPAPVFNRI